ncbi:MAG: beta-galactosidase trimerization domain-containing protein [Deltaproteobacteria bacterium]|nr:beta-galactosidase trimerization domain-containing protein [Candidatus Tharpella sp.]
MKHRNISFWVPLIFIGIVWVLVTEFFWGTPVSWSEVQRKGVLESVKAVPMPTCWQHFRVLIWPYRTDVQTDLPLYRHLGLGGFQIDRGAGKHGQVKLAGVEQFPYYVGHVADKGILHLTGENAKKVTSRRTPLQRPFSLADPEVTKLLKHHLQQNITDVRSGPVLAYAFDDEISLGWFTNPADVDTSEASLAWFREWLQDVYGSIAALNNEWDETYNTFTEVVPVGFEKVRKRVSGKPLSNWNLAPWIDFRHFMDFQFAAVLAELTKAANRLDPRTPAGFVGGQAPGPWGGYDYALLSRAVQWVEAYDLLGTNELLRSWWNRERRPRMQTFFASGNPKRNSWFLWYYYLHGNQAVICWPEGWFTKKDGCKVIAPHILELEKTFRELQGSVGEIISDQQVVFDPDPIGIYYSHPSIQASWVMDAMVHGSTWSRRLSSIDNKNQSAGLLRNVWCKTLEDLGYQYDFISYLDVLEGQADLGRFRVIILPKTVCLSQKEVRALESFVRQGGILVADYLCGVMDEHGRGRKQGILDSFFGLVRDEMAGYLGGTGLSEIDGELWEQPYEDRFPAYRGASLYKGLPVFERGLSGRRERQNEKEKAPLRSAAPGLNCLIENKLGLGRTVYLNLTPLLYWSPKHRSGKYGDAWRHEVGRILQQAGLKPRVEISENNNSVQACMLESLWWRKDSRHFLGIIKNPIVRGSTDSLEKDETACSFDGVQSELSLRFQRPVHLTNLRTGKKMGLGTTFTDSFRPWEGNLYQVK